MADSDPQADENEIYPPLRMRFLRPEQVKMIDEALAAIGEYGEVHLVVEKGRLRFVRTERSLDVNKYVPGHLVER